MFLLARLQFFLYLLLCGSDSVSSLFGYRFPYKKKFLRNARNKTSPARRQCFFPCKSSDMNHVRITHFRILYSKGKNCICKFVCNNEMLQEKAGRPIRAFPSFTGSWWSLYMFVVHVYRFTFLLPLFKSTCPSYNILHCNERTFSKEHFKFKGTYVNFFDLDSFQKHNSYIGALRLLHLLLVLSFYFKL